MLIVEHLPVELFMQYPAWVRFTTSKICSFNIRYFSDYFYPAYISLCLIIPIISIYHQLPLYTFRWIIRAKVINKSDIRKWENSKGVGQLFSFEIADESAEIKCTAFKELVDQFYDMVHVNTYFQFIYSPTGLNINSFRWIKFITSPNAKSKLQASNLTLLKTILKFTLHRTQLLRSVLCVICRKSKLISISLKFVEFPTCMLTNLLVRL